MRLRFCVCHTPQIFYIARLFYVHLCVYGGSRPSPRSSVPGGCLQNACSKFQSSGVSVIFAFYKMTDVTSCGFIKSYEKCNFIRPAKLEQICEESWSDIRKQLREITDSTLVNKAVSPLNI